MPAYKDLAPDEYNGQFNCQMLLTDGNRIDLTFAAVEKAAELMQNDPVGRVLLDKDGILQNAVFTGEDIYYVQPPTKKAFEDCCNSFWWIVQNIAKGINRKELPYDMKMLEIARDDLNQLVVWHIGMRQEYAVLAGKMGKHFEKYLSENHWKLYRATYAAPEYETIWQATFAAGDLLRALAAEIAGRYNYRYPHGDDAKMTKYLRRVRKLPYATASFD